MNFNPWNVALRQELSQQIHSVSVERNAKRCSAPQPQPQALTKLKLWSVTPCQFHYAHNGIVSLLSSAAEKSKRLILKEHLEQQ